MWHLLITYHSLYFNSQVISDLMSKLESIFTKSYLKGDKSAPSLSPQMCNLHRAALESWSLLLSIATPSTVRLIVDRSVLCAMISWMIFLYGGALIRLCHCLTCIMNYCKDCWSQPIKSDCYYPYLVVFDFSRLVYKYGLCQETYDGPQTNFVNIFSFYVLRFA